MQHTKFLAFFATAMVGLTTAHAGAQGAMFGDETVIEAQSWDRDGLYASLSGLLVFPEDSDITSTDPRLNSILLVADSTIEYDVSAGISGAIGYEFSGNFRGEVQYSYIDTRMNAVVTTLADAPVNGNGSVQTLMLNAFYDFPMTTQIQPYVGLGVGVAHHSSTLTSVDGVSTELDREDDTTLAYQAMVGIGYRVDARTTLSVGARYIATDDPDLGPLSSEFSALVLEFGIRLGF